MSAQGEHLFSDAQGCISGVGDWRGIKRGRRLLLRRNGGGRFDEAKVKHGFVEVGFEKSPPNKRRHWRSNGASIRLSNRTASIDSIFALDRGSVAAERFGMTDLDEDNFPSMHIVLEREDPARNVARYYVLSIEPTLFAKATLVRRWGRIGSAGRERLLFCDNAAGAQTALQTWLDRKRRRGYLLKR